VGMKVIFNVGSPWQGYARFTGPPVRFVR
jgi:hypothetical protein